MRRFATAVCACVRVRMVSECVWRCSLRPVLTHLLTDFASIASASSSNGIAVTLATQRTVATNDSCTYQTEFCQADGWRATNLN